ncbi:MFS transporter [Amycolatopsis antarctica]|uniref:MFS transporter n=1 Tax=Amycolatopsis antarctica TaxID=1854586 RepID=A0A263D258_9PSEU|nr:MFS transporter [Amycolatopsis antarctica]OZM72552.1 MFS transporter [Amycolatopsis antarctica]
MARAAGRDVGPSALDEPRTPVRLGWTSLLFLANLGLWFALITPIQLLLPQQAELLDAAAKETIFGLVAGAGALVAAVAAPLAGAASDRTSSRFGRRGPWAVGGAVTGGLGFLALAGAQDVPQMTAGWCLAQAGLNATLAALSAALPDRVPVLQRGRVAGVVGTTQILGTLVGTLVITTFIAGPAGGYLVCAAVVLACVLTFVLSTEDAVLPRSAAARQPLGAALRGLWVSPREHPDFAWAWGGHFLTQVGNALGVMYLLFFLTDVVRLPDPEGGLLIAMGIYAAAVVLGAVVTGTLSDRSGRRKPYIYLSVAVMAVASALLAVWQTWPGTMLAALLLGLGFGVYAAVGLALLTQVLPAASGRAKDLGILNISNSLPQVLAPVIATVVLTTPAGYRGLYALAAVLTLLAGVLLSRVRAVP